MRIVVHPWDLFFPHPENQWAKLALVVGYLSESLVGGSRRDESAQGLATGVR